MREELLKQGAFSWFELMSDDAEASRDFYKELFGWEFENYPMGDMQYYVVMLGGEGIGGIMKKPAQAAGMPSHWATYVTVEDIAATVKKAEELGGKVLVPPTEIPKIGTFAVIMDKEGAAISAMQYVPMPEKE